jgi:hypothetical protein
MPPLEIRVKRGPLWEWQNQGAEGRGTVVGHRVGEGNLLTVHISYSIDSICKGLLYIRSVFESKQTTDRQVDVTVISTVSFDVSVSQVLWPLQ